MIYLILIIPVVLAFYFIGKWLKESEKRDDEKRKREEEKNSKLPPVIKSESSFQKIITPLFNVVITIVLIFVVLYFVVGFIASSPSPYGDCGDYGCEPPAYDK